ncbi:CGNR zinc finger domain-containing protein [Larkinella knui]|uniref:Zf-CGNR multi-domain protein n=1 Tax=Larkinella knui TaxID=2025310 RepID=A0A3P1CXQ7_9BACT|nr:CGNR zinc finger domain-containing protein [Larkinella knui]RRB17654.1 zf-CGNR multi-domain protein [Larkinella knui]
MAKVSTITEMDLAGGAACLDFVNTALEFDEPVERLHTYQDLLRLIRRLSLLDENTLAALTHRAEADPGQAERVLQKARQVRQAMLPVFAALAKGEPEQLTAPVLEAFNEAVNEALDKRVFLRQADQLALSWAHPQTDLLQAVWVFSLSAYELLTNQDQKLIKQCGACAWLFLDTTKNHRRKWCDMQTCGTSVKGRRYYQRKKQA